MGLCHLGGLAQIVCLQKQECGDGPQIGWGGGGVLRPAMRAFRRKNMGIELVAGAVLASGPGGSFLGTALFVSVGKKLRALAEDDDERFHGGSWLVGNEGAGRLGRQADPRERAASSSIRRGQVFAWTRERTRASIASPSETHQ